MRDRTGDRTLSRSAETTARVAVGISIVSLLLSTWTFVSTLDADEIDRGLQDRLACLELEGANDCGPDGADLPSRN
jgi:hypothetical protein